MTHMTPADGPNLSQLQALLYGLIVAPKGVAEALTHETIPIDLGQIVVGDARMSAVERAEIYADAYFYRLLEVLKEDFPATLAVTGADEFHNLATAYLIAHQPSEPSLLYAGQYLADYLDRSAIPARWPFIADLARLERALIDSFHAADAPALDRAALESIPPDEWPTIGLKLHPATRVLKLRLRVDEIVHAIAENRQSPPPALAEPLTLIVWRKQTEVFHRCAELPESITLDFIERGRDLGAICEAVGAVTDENLPRLINRLLERWLHDGLLQNIRATPAE
jgi:hypothetical protein